LEQARGALDPLAHLTLSGELNTPRGADPAALIVPGQGLGVHRLRSPGAHQAQRVLWAHVRLQAQHRAHQAPAAVLNQGGIGVDHHGDVHRRAAPAREREVGVKAQHHEGLGRGDGGRWGGAHLTQEAEGDLTGPRLAGGQVVHGEQALGAQHPGLGQDPLGQGQVEIFDVA
jgi:hypothetical protein